MDCPKVQINLKDRSGKYTLVPSACKLSGTICIADDALMTSHGILKELNRFNDPNEVGEGNVTNTFGQVIEDKEALIKQMKEVQHALFSFTTDNLEEFSSEISTIEDKTELLKLKKALISARDCCNMVRTFGDEELKAAFAALELPKISQMISEVQHHIDNIHYQTDLHGGLGIPC